MSTCTPTPKTPFNAIACAHFVHNRNPSRQDQLQLDVSGTSLKRRVKRPDKQSFSLRFAFRSIMSKIVIYIIIELFKDVLKKNHTRAF